MKTIILSLFVFFVITTNAQNIEFKSSNFKDDKEGLKLAQDAIKIGDEQFNLGEEAIKNKQNPKMTYKNALAEYEKANKFNPNNAELNYKIGKCLLQLFTKIKSVEYLEKAIKLDPEVNDDVYYCLGLAYQYKYEFDKAIKQYEILKERLKNKQLEELKITLEKRQLECKTAKELYNNPVKAWTVNLKELNSEYPDYCPTITLDEETLMFNSKRASNIGGKKSDDGFYFSDIYITEKKNGKWSEPKKIGNINTEGHDECCALSPDGQRLFIYKNDNGDGNIYECVLDGYDWRSPIKLSDKINLTSNETHACYTNDGLKIYFITDGGYGGEGGRDIFFSGLMDPKINQWGKSVTISHELNTKYNEGSVYIHPDGKTMYFSSEGHNSMGGYDIFMSVQGPDGRWSNPVNMGYPINTPYDELYFTISASGKTAYVSSNREENSKGELDIYKIRFIGDDKPTVSDNEDQLLANFINPISEATLEKSVSVESKNLTVLKGIVKDGFTNAPVAAEIEVVDNVKNQVIMTILTNNKTGKFLISLPSGINYGIAVKAKGYLFHSENFNLPVAADYQLIEKEIILKNIAIGNKIVLKNIFFDTGKSTIKPESTSELQRLIGLLNDVPSLRIEISGHTDNVGSEESNLQLSERRAKEVVNYLISKGIAASRLEAKGYGSTAPVADNSTADGRQINRRTEFKILKN